MTTLYITFILGIAVALVIFPIMFKLQGKQYCTFWFLGIGLAISTHLLIDSFYCTKDSFYCTKPPKELNINGVRYEWIKNSKVYFEYQPINFTDTLYFSSEQIREFK